MQTAMVLLVLVIILKTPLMVGYRTVDSSTVAGNSTKTMRYFAAQVWYFIPHSKQILDPVLVPMLFSLLKHNVLNFSVVLAWSNLLPILE